MSDVELRVVHEPDDYDPFGCVVECHDHREPTVEELLQALRQHPDTEMEFLASADDPTTDGHDLWKLWICVKDRAGG
jgi:hypothetical protein